MLTGGLWSTAANLGLFIWCLNSGRGIRETMAMTFTSLVLIQFFKAYNFRSDRHPVFDRPFANTWLNLAVIADLAMLVIIIYEPFLQAPFGTFSLTAPDWMLVICLSATVVPVLETAKWIERRMFPIK
jgi:Ca2+-transporting ATPase